MGYAQMFSPCANCGRLFGFNPHRVPSVRINGERRPICKPCIEEINPIREAKGLPPAVVHSDAYEPVDEREL